MAELTSGAIDDTMKYFHAGYYSVGGQELYVSRTGWTGELGYEIYSEDRTTDHRSLWDCLMTVGAKHGMVYGSMASMEIRRLEAGILDNVTDFDTSMTPFAAGLGNFLDLEKTGYVGHEAIASADRRQVLFGVTCSTATPDYRGAVFSGDVSVGHITAAAWSPCLQCGIGYVRFNEPGEWLGTTVTMTTESGDKILCEVVELPFYDKEKRIPRGLDTTIP